MASNGAMVLGAMMGGMALTSAMWSVNQANTRTEMLKLVSCQLREIKSEQQEQTRYLFRIARALEGKKSNSV